MKKTLLMFGLVAPVMVFAQQNTKQQVPAHLQENIPMVQTFQGDHLGTAGNPQSSQSTTNKPATKKKLGKAAPSYIEIGSTRYDLQTNSSVGRRIITKGDKVSATWTTAQDGDPYPSRGTGYSHDNGSGFPATVTTKLEPAGVRTGWPSVGYLANDSEVIFSHVATSNNGGFRMLKNNGPGTSFTVGSSEVLASTIVGKPIWGRMATDGNQTIHIIANYSDSAADNPQTTKLAGVRDPLVYSRSINGGITWEVENITLPGYDSTLYHEGGGDQYAIDVRGDVVAIVIGGLGNSVVMWKSTDAGQNWTRTMVSQFTVLAYDNSQAIGENQPTNDGSVDVVIDDNDDAHIFWGASQLTNRPGLTDSSLFTPGTSQLIYWNEGNPTELDTIGFVFDRDNNDTLNIFAGTTGNRARVDDLGNSIGAARYGNTSLVTMPSAGFDAAGNLYVVYSSPVEYDATIDFQNFRDVYIVYSTDGGASWSIPQNITQAEASEDVFACIPKRFGTTIPVIFQRDDEPGTALQNADPNGDNFIMFGNIPTANVLNNSIGTESIITGINKVDNTVDVVMENYPNPFADYTNVMIYLNRPADVTVNVTNLLGQTVSTQSFDKLNTGNHNLTIQRNGMTSGVYFYTIKAGNASVTRKMIVD